MVDQSKAFLSFSRQVMRRVEKQDYDLVLATSSRLMSAVLGAWIARQKQALLYLDIRDIFVDTIMEVLSKNVALFAKPLFSYLESWAINRAARVNLVSPGFAAYFLSRYPERQFSYFTNGIDEEFVSAASQISGNTESSDDPLTVLYAGNLGEGQGLHIILPALARRMEARLRFRIIGDGGRKKALRTALAASGIENVELLPPVGREVLVAAYKDADILFLHLNDYSAFKKVLPSKLFEYAAMGKPIWAGLSGYAADFVRSEINNSAVFHPCDAADAERVFADLDLRARPRIEFVKKYARDKIATKMAEEIVMIATRGH
jgi:glycosyltransferase involved in cell wall biosynthesis